jgi:hypothetical protein
MSNVESTLYEAFVDARKVAMASSDQYQQAEADDPRRPVLWADVVRQTETARRLLESWLPADPPLPPGERAHETRPLHPVSA